MSLRNGLSCRRRHTIAKPEEYDFWRAYKRPSGKPDEPVIFNFDSPEQKKIGFDPAKSSTYWGYRRIIDVRNFEPGTFQSDLTLVNWRTMIIRWALF